MKNDNVASKIIFALLFIISSLFLPLAQATATDHYIRAGATGLNNGSDWDNAWASFSSVTWTRGDTYYVASGTYPENVSISRAVSGTLWIYVKKATVGDHGTDTAWDDSYATGQAEIDGTLVILYSYVDIDGVTGYDNSGHGIKVHYTGCDSVFNGKSVVTLGQGADSIHLRHMEIAGCGFGTYDSTDGLYHQSLPANPSFDIQISDCWIHDVSRNGVTIGNHKGTAFTDGNIGFLFENNRLERTGGCLYPDWHGQGVQVYGGTEDYMIFRNNKFIDISGTGYIAFLGGTINDHIRIYNNVFYSTDRATFTASPGVITFLDSVVSVNNALIYNNTFYNIDLKGVTNWCSSGTGNELKNNMFVASRFTYGQLGFISQYNDYYDNIGAGSVGVPTGEVGQQTESADPFINSANYDFHLKSTANAVNSGFDLSSIFATDKEGIVRPQGSGWDIGAYEYVSAALKGDVNNDTKVDVLDVQALVNHILGIQDYGGSADANDDGSVDVLDVQLVVNVILGG